MVRLIDSSAVNDVESVRSWCWFNSFSTIWARWVSNHQCHQCQHCQQQQPSVSPLLTVRSWESRRNQYENCCIEKPIVVDNLWQNHNKAKAQGYGVRGTIEIFWHHHPKRPFHCRIDAVALPWQCREKNVYEGFRESVVVVLTSNPIWEKEKNSQFRFFQHTNV